MVDDGARAELGDRQETRAREEVIAPDLAPTTGDVGGQGQPGEAVAWQEAFAGEVPVAVEVGLCGARRVGEQVDLRLGLGAEPLGLLMILRAGAIRDNGVLEFPLLHRGPIQAPPAVARLVEPPPHLLQDFVEPAVAVPVCLRQLVADVGEHPVGTLAGALAGPYMVDAVADPLQQGQGETLGTEIDDLPQ